MTGSHEHLSKLVKNKIAQRVELGDNDKYVLKGIGCSTFQLELGGNVSINNILYVPGLNKNLLCISSLEDKWNRISFVDGTVLLWKKDASFESTKIIGVELEAYIVSLDIQFKPCYTTPLKFVNYGIEGTLMLTTKLYLEWKILLKVYLELRFIMMEFARDVPLVKMLNEDVLAKIVDPKES